MKKGSSNFIFFVFLIAFWTILGILSSYLEIQSTKTTIADIKGTGDIPSDDKSGNFLSGIFDTLDDIPIIQLFVPLAKVLTFQYADDLPPAVTMILDMFAVITIFVLLSTVKGG